MIEDGIYYDLGRYSDYYNEKDESLPKVERPRDWPENPTDATDPGHYKDLNPEPREVAIAWNLNFCEGNVLKYLARWRRKNGLEDLQKCKNYLNRLIQQVEEEGGS